MDIPVLSSSLSPLRTVTARTTASATVAKANRIVRSNNTPFTGDFLFGINL